MSEKRRAQCAAQGVTPYSTIQPKRAGTIGRNKKRQASELLRCFGTPERRAWMKAQPCIACLTVDRIYSGGKIEQAHVTDDGTKGAGRRSGFRCIVPLCANHHRRFDRYLAPFNDPANRDWIIRHAERFAAAWDQLAGGEAAET